MVRPAHHERNFNRYAQFKSSEFKAVEAVQSRRSFYPLYRSARFQSFQRFEELNQRGQTSTLREFLEMSKR